VTSERQIAANRANALHSTGPKTLEGKTAVRLNAFRHGLLARDVVLPEEDWTPSRTSRTGFGQTCRRWGPIEEILVDRVVNTMWRLRRLERAEAALFDWRVRHSKSASS